MVTRRRLLVSAGVPALAACAPGVRVGNSDRGVDGAVLHPVRISEDRIIRTVVGLRPHRPSGFVVRAEQLDDRLLVHNYGHGGGVLSPAIIPSTLRMQCTWIPCSSSRRSISRRCSPTSGLPVVRSSCVN